MSRKGGSAEAAADSLRECSCATGGGGAGPFSLLLNFPLASARLPPSSQSLTPKPSKMPKLTFLAFSLDYRSGSGHFPPVLAGDLSPAQVLMFRYQPLSPLSARGRRNATFDQSVLVLL